jgi:L-fucose mutarotase/ribose pyranase (RbsD/FucU family)
MDKKELVDAVIEMIKQDTAAGDLENVDRIMTCAFKEKLKVCYPITRTKTHEKYKVIQGRMD